jgi:hypothetical protein
MAHNVKYRVYLDEKINKYRVAIFNFKGEPVDHFGEPVEHKVDAVRMCGMLNRTFSIVEF